MNEPQRQEQPRSIEAKIARLRRRLAVLAIDPALRGVILGLLDLLEDEL